MASFLITLITLLGKLRATSYFCSDGCRMHDRTGAKKQRGRCYRGKNLHENSLLCGGLPRAEFYYISA